MSYVFEVETWEPEKKTLTTYTDEKSSETKEDCLDSVLEYVKENKIHCDLFKLSSLNNWAYTSMDTKLLKPIYELKDKNYLFRIINKDHQAASLIISISDIFDVPNLLKSKAYTDKLNEIQYLSIAIEIDCSGVCDTAIIHHKYNADNKSKAVLEAIADTLDNFVAAENYSADDEVPITFVVTIYDDNTENNIRFITKYNDQYLISQFVEDWEKRSDVFYEE